MQTGPLALERLAVSMFRAASSFLVAAAVLCGLILADQGVAAVRSLAAIGPATHVDGSPGTVYTDGGLGTAVERTLTPTLVVETASIPDVGSPPALYYFIVANRSVADCDTYDIPLGEGGAADAIVWEGESETNSVTVPAGRLNDNTTYFWCAFAEWDDDFWVSGVSDFRIEVMPRLAPVQGVGLVRSATPTLQVGHLPQANPALSVSYRFTVRANVGPVGNAGAPGAVIHETTQPGTSFTVPPLTDLDQYWWEVTATAPVPGGASGAIASRTIGPIRMFVNVAGTNLPLKPLEGLGSRVWTVGTTASNPLYPNPQILTSAYRQMQPLCLVLITEYACSTNPFFAGAATATYPYQFMSLTDWAIRADGTKCYSCPTKYMWSGDPNALQAGLTQTSVIDTTRVGTVAGFEPDIWFRWDNFRNNFGLVPSAHVRNGEPVFWTATVSSDSQTWLVRT